MNGENDMVNVDKTEFMWQYAGKGIRILRVYGNALEVTVPDNIEGIPVTEIGAYCFSASEHLPSTDIFYTSMTHESGEERRIPAPNYPCICGKYIEKVSLPDTVTTLHNAAFYNCRKLKTLSVGKGIHAIGSDEFMNCVELRQIIVRAGSAEPSGLPLILERLITEVEVLFCPQDEIESVLFFPEYYEWLDEISPAHIFSRSIEGEGFRMRRVFQDDHIDFRKYDQCFPNVLNGETDPVICRIALNRLRYARGLSKEHQKMYEDAVRERYDTMINMEVKLRNLSWLTFLVSYFSPSRELLSSWMNCCINSDWGEGSAYLMEEIHKKTGSTFAGKTFDFEDF